MYYVIICAIVSALIFLGCSIYVIVTFIQDVHELKEDRERFLEHLKLHKPDKDASIEERTNYYIAANAIPKTLSYSEERHNVIVAGIIIPILLMFSTVFTWGSVLNNKERLFNRKQELLTEIKINKETFGNHNMIYYQEKIDDYNKIINSLKEDNNYWRHTSVVFEEEINFYLITQSEIDML